MSEQNSSYQDWMKEALCEASRTLDGGPYLADVPVGSLILKDGEVIGRGHNQREESCDPTAHAELIALRAAAKRLESWRLTGCILIVTLEPCAMCAEAIIQSRISTLVFGAYDQRAGACGSAFNLFVGGRSYPLPEIIGGIEEEECERLLADFFKSVRNKYKLP
jgi:tRNA(adenine34) deaminase